ncbi:hypothetical protein MOQ_006157 [Trypanosoma cruzi marinkellei]|uniref:Uncharacterized protein n=1 Tax=Trypanosoma cruzi marinkellei TaxID=85056 RepID=K2N601_TRYCR|nr:hypothetical protein MOQ_006157 [Trypanosoma cruzi marinkellei]
MQFDEFNFVFPGYQISVSNSSSGSLHCSLPAPVLPLAPTVGGRVVLNSKHCNHDAFIWEDKEMDLVYLQCAKQHMLVGSVLRETERHLVVRFEIPYRCLPPVISSRHVKRLFGEGRGEEGASNKRRSKVVNDESDKVEKEEGGDRFMGKEGQEGGGNKSASVADMALTRFVPETDGVGGGSVGSPFSRPTRFVVGIVPVLALTHETVLGSNSLSNAGGTFSANEVSEKSQLITNTTVSGAYHINENPNEVLHVSLSVTRSGCISLLQNLLEQHDKLECVSLAVANRDFKLAANHIMAVIDARLNLSNQQKEACKGIAESRQSFPTWVQSNPHAPGTDARRQTEEFIPEDRRSRFVMILDQEKEGLSRRGFQPHSLTTPNEEEHRCLNREGVSAFNDKGSSGILQSKPDNVDLDFASINKMHKLHILWNSGKAIKELAPLYAFLSFLHFQDGHYEQCLEDAMTALAHDMTCIEAYTRVISGFMILGLEKEAILTAAVAVKRCLVLSPQFARLYQLAHVRFFYHRNLGSHSIVDVSPRLRRPSIPDLGSAKDGTSLSKANRQPRRPTTFRVPGISNMLTSPLPFSCVPPPSLRKILSGSSPPMDYFLRNLRVRAARGFERNETVFSEEVPLQVLLWSLPDYGSESSNEPFSDDNADLANPWMLCRSRFCAYCGHPLVSKSVLLAGVREKTNRAMADRVRWNFSEKNSLPCLAGCGDHYCDEICRNRAALEYHWIECALLPGDESESEDETPPQDGTMTGEVTKTHEFFPSTAPSGEEDTHASLLEILPYAKVPLRRRDVRSLVNICRRLNNRQGCLGVADLPVGSLRESLRQELSTSSFSEAIMERERLYLSSIQACCSAIPEIRAVFSSYYASVGAAIMEKAPNVITAPLLVMGRLLASVLCLIMPTAATKNDIFFRAKNHFIGLECRCRERSDAVKKIVARYASRGFTSSGASPSDRHDIHGLCLAEEVLQQIRVPFFADTNLLQPSTVWEILSEPPAVKNTANNDDASSGTAATTLSIRRGFDRAVELLRAINDIVQSRLRDEVVAFSLSKASDPFQRLPSEGVSVSGGGDSRFSKSQSDDTTLASCSSVQSLAGSLPFLRDVGSLAVWLVEEHSKVGFHMAKRPSVWTFGRLLGFLGKRRFMEQFWDFCVCSYCVVPKCVLTVGVGDSVPEHQQEGWKAICREYTVLVAVMGPLTSLVTDLSAFGGDVCSRFFKDAAANGQWNPLHLRKGDSPAASMLSINSLPHESEEMHSRTTTQSMGGGENKASSQADAIFSTTMPVVNLELCSKTSFKRSGERRVTMKAQRPINPGEELCYEGC